MWKVILASMNSDGTGNPKKKPGAFPQWAEVGAIYRGRARHGTAEQAESMSDWMNMVAWCLWHLDNPKYDSDRQIPFDDYTPVFIAIEE